MGAPFSFFSKLFGRSKKGGGKDELSQIVSDVQLSKLQSVIKLPIKNKSLYIEAFIHRSFLESHSELNISNERLEFLGDSVLSLAVAEYLFNTFPEEDEGFLTKIRAKFVNRNSLGKAAESIDLADFILIGNNISRSFIKNSKTVLSDTLEALIGAIYLDHGLEESKRFVYRTIIRPRMKNEDYLIDRNYKSQLLEYAQANKLAIPTYDVINEEGPQHDRVFTVRVLMGKRTVGTGKGKNKKTAEQNAAKLALEKLKVNDNTGE